MMMPSCVRCRLSLLCRQATLSHTLKDILLARRTGKEAELSAELGAVIAFAAKARAKARTLQRMDHGAPGAFD